MSGAAHKTIAKRFAEAGPTRIGLERAGGRVSFVARFVLNTPNPLPTEPVSFRA